MLVVDAVKTTEIATLMPRWRVDIVRKHAEHLGIVTAPNAQEALHRAASLFRIKPDHYSKFIITKIEEYELGRYTD
jgi:predicted metal-dependent phosphoesterase TrpH